MEEKKEDECWRSIPVALLPAPREAGQTQGWSIDALIPKWKKLAGDLCCSTCC